MMVAEAGDGDAWNRAFDAPHLDKFDAPTVEGVDFPSLGVYQAWNDVESGALHVGTYAAAPERRGDDTSWRVTNLPDPGDVFILCDGAPFSRFAAVGPNAIRIDGDIGLHQYQVFTGYRGPDPRQAEARRQERRRRATAAASVAAGAATPPDRPPRDTRQATASFSPGNGPTCACCTA